MSRARDLANLGDGIDATQITSGVFADGRIQASNVTQHEGSIDALGTVASGTFNGTIGSNATFPNKTIVGWQSSSNDTAQQDTAAGSFPQDMTTSFGEHSHTFEEATGDSQLVVCCIANVNLYSLSAVNNQQANFVIRTSTDSYASNLDGGQQIHIDQRAASGSNTHTGVPFSIIAIINPTRSAGDTHTFKIFVPNEPDNSRYVRTSRPPSPKVHWFSYEVIT